MWCIWRERNAWNFEGCENFIQDLKVLFLASLFEWTSTSSKVRQLHSFHSIHIRQSGTSFQISDECLPNQFHIPNKRSATISVKLTEPQKHQGPYSTPQLIHRKSYWNTKSLNFYIIYFNTTSPIGINLFLFLFWPFFKNHKPSKKKEKDGIIFLKQNQTKNWFLFTDWAGQTSQTGLVFKN